jgi:hypothetical protein
MHIVRQLAFREVHRVPKRRIKVIDVPEEERGGGGQKGFFPLIPNKNLVHKKLQQTYYAVKNAVQVYMMNNVQDFTNSE